MPHPNDNVSDVPDRINGALMVYHHPLLRNATTIMEHVNAFEKHSRFKIWSINTELGFPPALRNMRFKVILLHYSLFGIVPYQLGRRFLEYLRRDSGGFKIAFFQDEHHYCIPRYHFLNEHGVDMVYTLLEPEFIKEVYGKYTDVPQFRYNLTGYVSDEMVDRAQRLTLQDEDRRFDIGYRGRTLKYYMGKEGLEKARIASGFLQRAKGLDLKLNIGAKESDRIYGEGWYDFVANCRAMLGTEAGVSVFDIEDVVRPQYEKMIAENPSVTFEEVSERILGPWEGNIYYRTISPRHFEAAAFRVCQILFEGRYSGVLQPMVHYIPLKKDFSNFDEVVRLFGDKTARQEIVENAYRDLIASGKYSYRRFIEGVDRDLATAGLETGLDEGLVRSVTEGLNQGLFLPRIKTWAKYARYYDFPGRRRIVSLLKGLGRTFGRIGRAGTGRKKT